MRFKQAVRRGLRRFDNFTRTKDGKQITVVAFLVLALWGVVISFSSWVDYHFRFVDPPYFERTEREYTAYDRQGHVFEHIVWDQSGNEVSHIYE